MTETASTTPDTASSEAVLPDEAATGPQRTPLPELLLVKIPYALGGAILLAAVAINVANVIGRYIFFRPIFWAEEVLMYMIIWGVFLAAGAITYRGLHLRMDLLVVNVKGKIRAALGALTVAIALLCAPFMMVQSFRVVRNYVANGEVSIAAQFPLAYTHVALFVGFVLIFAAAAVRVRAYVTGKFD